MFFSKWKKFDPIKRKQIIIEDFSSYKGLLFVCFHTYCIELFARSAVFAHKRLKNK